MNERMNSPRWVGAWHVISGRDDGGMAQDGGMEVMRNAWIVTVFGRW